MRINVINISPEYSAIWKVGYNIYLELKKDNNFDVKFIDLWKTKKISHNNLIRSLQLLKGINFNSKKNEINYYMTPLLSKTMLINNAKQNIMFIHDLYPLFYLNNLVSLLCKLIYPKSKKADLLICNSNSTKKEYLQVYGVSKKIFTNYLGIDSIYFNNKKIKKNKKLTFISIGRDEQRKNIKFMLKILKSLNLDFQLFRIGDFSKDNLEIIQKYKLMNKIKIFNNISEEKLIELYSKAHILLFPSIYEGFGMPPLEAMACGCIPLVANKTSLPEVVVKKDLILDLDISKWLNAIKKINSNNEYRNSLINFCINHSKKFTWEKHKKRFIKLIDE